MGRRVTLTSRDRVNRMFMRREQDRIPRCDTFWPETVDRWRSEGLQGDAGTALKRLECDLHGISWISPQIFPGREELVAEDEQTKVIRDGFGKTVRYWKGRSGTPEHLGFDCETREIWEQQYKPRLLRNPLQLKLAELKQHYCEAGERWSYLAGVEPFELSRYVMGDEITLIAMCEDPEWIADFARVYTDVCLKHFDAIYDAGVHTDGLWIYGDMAYNHATVCSPSHYRELIWPQHKRLVDWAHARGMKFIFHTDGDVNGVIDLYLSAGIDCLQPLEAKANMDVRVLAPRYGDRLALFGNINVMTMATNNLEKIEAEIASKFAAGKATRGYMYHSDHSVPPSVSWQTYQQIIGLVDKYGWY
ncbi:MAG TPA: uroporphyrinogen decarboxylase family protein [Tepidisphaeraceae bacterium]|nr:uroporphyrinogen decarboxylase family protein [Tepidisphaeraceae bacterium]